MATVSNQPAWLRGPVAGIPALLQPVAHALIDADEDVRKFVPGLSTQEIAAHPGGAASVGYHVKHAMGSLDRLFTYARGESLSTAQRAALAAEADPDLTPTVGAALVAAFDEAVERALEQLRTTADTTLLETRGVGRAQLPSTVLGLLFHAAEHTQRHVGQLVTTTKIVVASSTLG